MAGELASVNRDSNTSNLADACRQTFAPLGLSPCSPARAGAGMRTLTSVQYTRSADRSSALYLGSPRRLK